MTTDRFRRTHSCDALRRRDIGKAVGLAGFAEAIEAIDSYGSVESCFDLRDDQGDARIVLGPGMRGAIEVAEGDTLTVTGKVRERILTARNPSQPSGSIEIEAQEIRRLTKKSDLPALARKRGTLAKKVAAATLAAASRGLRLCPRVFHEAFGRALGRLAFGLSPRHRSRTERRIHEFLGVDLATAGRIARRCTAHFGRVACETLALPSYATARRQALIDVKGREHYDAAREVGLGVLVVSAHLGCWHLIPVWQARAGYPTDLVVRPQEAIWFDHAFRRWHEVMKNRVHGMKGAALATVQALRQGRSVFYHLDQNVHTPPRIFLPFLGKLASVIPTVGQLAARVGAPVVPAYCLPRPKGRFLLVYEPAILASPAGDLESRSRRVTEAANARIEAWVRRWPELWLWGHDRWKDQPYFPGEFAEESPIELEATQ